MEDGVYHKMPKLKDDGSGGGDEQKAKDIKKKKNARKRLWEKE